MIFIYVHCLWWRRSNKCYSVFKHCFSFHISIPIFHKICWKFKQKLSTNVQVIHIVEMKNWYERKKLKFIRKLFANKFYLHCWILHNFQYLRIQMKLKIHRESSGSGFFHILRIMNVLISSIMENNLVLQTDGTLA